MVERRPPLTNGEAGIRLLRALEATATSPSSGGELMELESERTDQLKTP
jgi:hypothetical protein